MTAGLIGTGGGRQVIERLKTRRYSHALNPSVFGLVSVFAPL
jgi:hypothetical protein